MAALGDLGELTAVAHEAKRYWDYPDSWIEAWREALTIREEALAVWTVLVAETPEGVAGFGAVDLRRKLAVLEHLWVRPAFIGRGIGRRLFRECAEAAVAVGAPTMETEADPHALGFYVKLGGRHVDDIPAEVQGVRRALPLVSFRLHGDDTAPTHAMNGGI